MVDTDYINLIEDSNSYHLENVDLSWINFNSLNNNSLNNNSLNNNYNKKRKRQLKINEASRKTRLKKKKQMKNLSNHIKRIHNIIINSDINNNDLIQEITNFDKTNLIK